MFIREKYLSQLQSWQGKATVKILVGVRRAGKTTLLDQFRSFLRRQEVSEDQIHVFNFDQLIGNELCTPHYLLQFLSDRLAKHQMNYLFFDEIEVVPQFAQVVQALNTLSNTDIYLASSSKMILQPAILKVLAPTTVIPVFPYDFAEYLKRNQQTADSQSLYQYLNQGGFPYTNEVHGVTNLQNYINGVFSSTIMTEFTNRAALCNPRLAGQLARHLIKHAGASQNVSQIVTSLQKHQIATSNKTVDFYLRFLQDTQLFYPCYCYDFDRHKIKTTNVKYYPVDPGLRLALTFQKNVLSQRILENLVFIELLSQGFEVYSGQVQGNNITFVAIKNGCFECFQVTFSLTNETNYRRAIKGLSKLIHKCQTTLLTANPLLNLPQHDGIQIIDIYRWLTTA